MGHSLDWKLRHQLENLLHVDPRGGQENFAQRFPPHQLVEPILSDDLPDEGKAVAVNAARGKSHDQIALLNAAPVDPILSLDDADGKAGHIVLPLAIQPWHLSGLSADQRASRLLASLRNPSDDLLQGFHLEFGDGEIIEEEKRFCPGGENIIHVHGDEVDPDRIVPIARDRDLQLGSHSVGAGDKIVLSQRENPSEAADAGDHRFQLANPARGPIQSDPRIQIGRHSVPFC